jgi:hypothetical protein
VCPVCQGAGGAFGAHFLTVFEHLGEEKSEPNIAIGPDVIEVAANWVSMESNKYNVLQ